ncbi:SIR2 family protein [Actinomyces sp. oral taxon 414]|uniref:SIR2 family protein n=1 Tax=Actinomyces sp. oral taxon 414 TaxID=712122 RepID=UPI00155DB5EA|nr:SIR2 family protein [Actinomyces sp. oral taxon 414]
MNKMHLTEDVVFPRDLITAHREGDLVIFVGAGASVDPPSRLPLFKELTRRLAERASVPFEETIDDNGKKIPQEPREYDRFLGAMPKNFDLRRHALELVSPPDSRPNPTHKAIMRLSAAYREPRVVTTNYDDHLAEAAAAAGIDLPARWDAPFLPQGDDFSGLVHIHGSKEGDRRGVVLTDEDFGNAYLSNGWATRFLVPMFRRYTVLFVGYSLGDLIMRYLARGMSAETRCYALVSEDKAARGDWERLGVQPIGYPVHKRKDGNGDHDALVKALQAWDRFARMGEREHRNRVKAIIDAEPESLGIVDHDYLMYCLEIPAGVRDFTNGTWPLPPEKAWAWLCWIDRNVVEFNTAFAGESTSESTNELLHWYASKFIADPKLHGAALDVVQRQGQDFNDFLFKQTQLYAQVLGEASPEAGSRWKVLLLHSIRRRKFDNAIPYRPASEAESLAVLAEAMRPRLSLNRRWPSGVDDDGIPAEPLCELAWDLDRESLGAHLSKAIEQAPAGDPRLGLILENALLECCEIVKSYNGDRRLGELNYEYRPAIEEHDQNNMSRCGIHAIIDALRDYGTKSQKADTDLADRWWCFGRALFRRLAIHLVTVSGLSENEKIDWLIERTNLYEPNYRHEIYHLLETAIENASLAVKERLLEYVLTAPSETDRGSDKLKQYNTYNLLTWLTQCDTNWEQARIARDDLQAEHPSFAPRRHPDFSMWVESGFIGERAPMSQEEFTSRLHQDARAVLEDLLRYPDDVCNLVRNTCTSQPHEGVKMLDTLNQISHDRASRVRDMRCAIVEGWGQAGLTGLEERVITEVRNLTDSDEEQVHRTISRFLCNQIQKRQKSPESSFTEQMRQIASQLWREHSEEFSNPHNIDPAGLAPLYLNSWPGEIAQYWVCEIDRRRHEHEEPDLTTEEETALINFLHSASPLRDATLPALSYHLFYLFQVAPEFTKRELLPFFSKNDTAAQTWEAFMYNPKCSIDLLRDGLLPAMIKIWDRIGHFTDNQTRNTFMNLTLNILSFVDIDPEYQKQLLNQTVLTQQGELAWQFAESACSFLEHQKEAEKDKIWNTWLHGHLANRLNGIPREARTEELAAWADLVPLLGTHIPDALRLFSNRVFPLTRSHFAPAQLNSIMKIHGEELVAFYAERLRTTSVENHYALVYEIKRFIQDMTNAIGEEKARPLVDATVDAGIPVESR